MRLILALLLVGGALSEDDDCPDFDCPVKDGSFAVSTHPREYISSQTKKEWSLIIYDDNARTLARADGITPASTSALLSSIALLAFIGTISSERKEISRKYFHLKGNTARTRTRLFVVLWHPLLRPPPPQPPLTRNAKYIWQSKMSFWTGLRNVTWRHASYLGATAAPQGVRSQMVSR